MVKQRTTWHVSAALRTAMQKKKTGFRVNKQRQQKRRLRDEAPELVHISVCLRPTGLTAHLPVSEITGFSAVSLVAPLIVPRNLIVCIGLPTGPGPKGIFR